MNDYTAEVQEFFLCLMVSKPELYARCQNILKADYFTRQLRPVMAFILQYGNDYKAVPSLDLIQSKTGKALQAIPVTRDVEEWFLDEIEKFCRHMEMSNIILNSPDELEKGNYGVIEAQIKEAMSISLQKDLGTDYFSDPAERLLRIRTSQKAISTGWRALDEKLFGGWAKKTLNIFAGQPGAGKSAFLQNISINYMEMGMNVVYITLELSEELVACRFDSMICEVPSKGITGKGEEIAMKLGVLQKRRHMGSLRIKKMPEGSTTTNDIRAYLREYEIQTGIRPDVVAVDYLDLVSPNNPKINPTDTFTKDKFVSEELRALSFELDCILMTASQLNRNSIDSALFDMSHIAGGISKLNTADNVMAIYRTVAMKERGLYELQLMKTRTSDGVGSRVVLAVHKETMRITDQDGGGVENIGAIATSPPTGLPSLSRMSTRT